MLRYQGDGVLGCEVEGVGSCTDQRVDTVTVVRN